MKVKEAEKKAPGGLAIDPKKQIFVSKINMENSPRAGNKDAAEEGVNTEGHLKNLRKKDYYENRVKKNFQNSSQPVNSQKQ